MNLSSMRSEGAAAPILSIVLSIPYGQTAASSGRMVASKRQCFLGVQVDDTVLSSSELWKH
jgi:hypothetical protein